MHSSCVSIQEIPLPSQDRAAASCHTLLPSLSASSLCPLQGLCLQSNAWIFPLQKHCHGKYPAHPSPLGLLESALQAWWEDHTSSNNGWHCRQDSRAPILSTWIKHHRCSPSRPAASGVWLSCRNSGSRQLPRDSRVYFCLCKLISYHPPPLLLSQGFVPGIVAREALALP